MLSLDEPTYGVDPIARRQFWDRVHLLAQQSGITVVVSTHYMDEAEHCDRLGLMHQRKLIAAGSPFELKAQAQARAGAMVVVQASDFSQAFNIISPPPIFPYFPHAMLYGWSTQWQSTNPGKDMEIVRRLLSDAYILAEITEQGLSMEETFVKFMETTGGDDV
jgi:ABC-type multidrug transport system ATPase subunit